MKKGRNSYLIDKAMKNYIIASIATMAIQQFNVTVDGIIVSHFVCADAFSSVNLYQPLSLAISAICTLFGIGATIRASKAIGDNDTPKVERILSTAIVSIFVVGALIALGAGLFIDAIAGLITTNVQFISHFTDYAQVMVFCSAITMYSMLFDQIVCVCGNPGAVTKSVVVSAFVNLSLDIVLVGFVGLGTAGSAWATVFSQICNIVLLNFILKKKSPYTLNPFTRASVQELKRNIIQGLPLIISNIILMLMFWAINTTMLNKTGAEGMFTLAICINLLSLGMMFSGGVGSAIMVIGGFLVGQHDTEGIRILIRNGIRIMLISTLSLVVMAEIFPEILTSLFGSDSSALTHYACSGIRIFVPILPLVLLTLMLANVYQMLGHLALTPVIVLTFPVVLVPSLYACSELPGDYSIWYAFPLTGCIVLLSAFTLTEIIRIRKGNMAMLTLAPLHVTERMLNISVNATVLGIADALPGIKAFISSLTDNTDKQTAISHCIEEVMLNIANHGSHNMDNHYFDVQLRKQDGMIFVSIKDDGIPFNPLTIPLAKQHFGMKMIKHFCENAEYKYMYSQNMLFMTWTE